MEDDLLSRALEVSDPAAGAVFADPRLRRILMLFAPAPLSVSEAAARSGADLKRLHHHVQKLRRLGLLVIDGEIRRPGRPIKLYRTAGEAFFVPIEILPRDFGDDLAGEMRGYLAANARRTTRGILVGAAPEGQIRARIVADEQTDPEALEIWRVLRLQRREARALEAELRAVLDRFQDSASGRGNVYLVHAAMARRRPEGGSVDNARR
ncbi:MAG TPA: winged helix-turn-helix domain-containing protein [Allosphingosinicella sp.]|jgi:hypothetical protein|nr:winged helix-turn-helix domain-containing protein [Allosphingosinicella sp.]